MDPRVMLLYVFVRFACSRGVARGTFVVRCGLRTGVLECDLKLNSALCKRQILISVFSLSEFTRVVTTTSLDY